MRPSLALSIGAIAFLLTGIPFVIAPAQVMSAVGWPATPNEAVVLARDGGVLMIGLAIIDWFGRNALGAPLRALLGGNISIRAAGAAVNAWECAVGITPSEVGPGLAVALAADIALLVVFVLALRRAGDSRNLPLDIGVTPRSRLPRMIHYSVDIAVDRPAADVFPYLADVTRHPSWMGGSQAAPISEGPMRPGYRYRHAIDEGEFEMEVTDFVPGVRLSARTVAGPFNWAGTFQVGPESTGSRVTSTGAIRLTGWKRLAEPFMGREVQRRERQELVRLKAIVEGEQV